MVLEVGGPVWSNQMGQTEVTPFESGDLRFTPS